MTASPTRPARHPPRRRWAWILIGSFAGSVLLVFFVLAWLLRSEGGRDFALARVQAALPAGALSWEAASGALQGPVEFRNLRYAHDGLVIEAGRVRVDLAPLALLSRSLVIEALRVEHGRIVLPAGDDAPATWPERFVLPDGLPAIELPVGIRLHGLALREVALFQGEIALAHLQQVALVGSLERGRVVIDQLDIDSDRGTLRARGDFDSARRWATDLEARVVLADAADPPLPLQVQARGDLGELKIDVTAALREPAQARIGLTGGLPDLRWTLALDAPRVDLARFGQEGAITALRLRGEGDANAARLDGELAYDGRRVRLEPSQLRYAAGEVHVEPLRLDFEPGKLEAEGRIDLRPAAPHFALRLAASGFAPVEVAAAQRVTVSGDARIDGPLDDYAIEADARLVRPDATASLTLAGRGSRERLALANLTLDTPGGGLQARGEVAWSPQPRWDLQATSRRFDPAWLAPDFPGAVDASLVTRGEIVDGAAVGSLTLDPLGGELRGRALGGRARIDFGADSGSAELALRLGSSRIDGEGRWGARIEGQLRLAPLQLADLMPDAAGELRGTLVFAGTRDAPAITAQIDGSALSVAGLEAGTLRLRADSEDGDRARLRLEADAVQLADQSFDQLVLTVGGTASAHALDLALRGDALQVELSLQGAQHDGAWQGELRGLSVTPAQRPAWTLRAPAALRRDADGTVRLAESCLVEAAASLCAEVDWRADAGEAGFSLQALPLAGIDPVLAQWLETPVAAYGIVSGQGRVVREPDGALRGTLELASDAGGLRLHRDAPRELLAYRDFALRATLGPERFSLRAGAGLAGDGLFLAEIESASPQAADGAITGRIEARLRDLDFLELASEQIVGPRGHVDARLSIGGTRAAPTFAGEARLSGFTAELPALGLQPRDGELRLRSAGARRARIEGSIRSGEGTLTIAGDYDAAPDAERTFALELGGTGITAIATPEFDAIVSPELQLALSGDRIRLRGKVTVPRARIDLEQIESATTPSPDVIVVDAESPSSSGAWVLDSEVSLALGEDVQLEGFGLDGKLEGQLAIRDRPGRATLARGGIQVSGEYKAYGQDLEITRGRLSYASTPIDNPALDIRAQREIDEITVGVQVRGTALVPELTLWSEPGLDQAEQLSYLVLGRPLRSASQADGAQLSQAAAAFGGNLLAQRLGARMGLDEVGVADSRALGGAALTVGKFLSPKLYVSYGVALFGSGQVVTFKYLLSRVWNVQIDSGTENRAALNYRLER